MKLYRVYVEGREDFASYHRSKAPANVEATSLARETERGFEVIVEQVEPKKIPTKELVVTILNGKEWVGTAEVLRRVKGKGKASAPPQEEDPVPETLLEPEASMDEPPPEQEALSDCCEAPLTTIDGAEHCRACFGKQAKKASKPPSQPKTQPPADAEGEPKMVWTSHGMRTEDSEHAKRDRRQGKKTPPLDW